MTSINPQKTSIQSSSAAQVQNQPPKSLGSSKQDAAKKAALSQGLDTTRKNIKQSVSLTILESESLRKVAKIYSAVKNPKLETVHPAIVYASATTFGNKGASKNGMNTF